MMVTTTSPSSTAGFKELNLRNLEQKCIGNEGVGNSDQLDDAKRLFKENIRGRRP